MSSDTPLHQMFFGERRPESFDGFGHDLATGSFEEMRVNVTFLHHV